MLAATLLQLQQLPKEREMESQIFNHYRGLVATSLTVVFHLLQQIYDALLLFRVMHKFRLEEVRWNEFSFRHNIDQSFVHLQIFMYTEIFHVFEGGINEIYMASPVHRVPVDEDFYHFQIGVLVFVLDVFETANFY